MPRLTRSFTLIELIITLAIMGILAAVAIARIVDLTEEATQASERQTAAAVRSGIFTYYADNKEFPSSLDSASAGMCSKTNPCFGAVLTQGGESSEDWSKLSLTTYIGPAGGAYTYNNIEGSFK